MEKGILVFFIPNNAENLLRLSSKPQKKNCMKPMDFVSALETVIALILFAYTIIKSCKFIMV
jgi:hypothetical protein